MGWGQSELHTKVKNTRVPWAPWRCPAMGSTEVIKHTDKGRMEGRVLERHAWCSGLISWS